MIPPSIADRMLLLPETGCWEWQNNRNNKHGLPAYVKRMVYSATVGPIPEGKYVIRLCATDYCVNPKHMQLGGPAEIAQVRHNRGTTARGERHGRWRNAAEYPLAPNLKTLPNGCQEWVGKAENRGRSSAFCRYLYEQAHGTIPKGQIITRTCGNVLCCALEHIGLTTYAALAQKRGKVGKKLSYESAQRIRELYDTGLYTYYQLATEYGVHASTISDVINDVTWTKGTDRERS